MQRLALLGVVCTALAVVGYAVGVTTPYPGRELTLVGVMVGTTLLFLGGESA
jgi:hypothetical protein